jgi:hypothetical protein
MKITITVIKTYFSAAYGFYLRPGQYNTCGIGGFKKIFKLSLSVDEFQSVLDVKLNNENFEMKKM